jgi:hypothetical protein
VEANTTHTHGVADRLAEDARPGLRGRLTGLVSRSGGRDEVGKYGGRAKLDDAGARLEHYLSGSNSVVLHRRRLPGRKRRISHLVIGPAGITVVDSRHYKARRANLEDGTIRVGVRRRADLINGVVAQVEAVHHLLTDTPFSNVPVEAALARRKVRGVPILQTVNGPRVIVCGTRRIAGEASRPGPLSASQVKALAAYLDGALAR